MSGLLYPGEEEFFIARGTSGQILCAKINGLALVLFYSTNCVYCKKLIPIFKKLPELVGGCSFAMINVSQARGIIRMSKNTVSPIEFVPYIIFYVNNKPYMRYNGPPEMQAIKDFVVEVANNIQNKQTFAPDKIKDAEREIPEYAIGKPLCGDGERCYVSYDDAYPEMPPGTNAPAERKTNSQKGQYLGYDSAYNPGEGGPDPNQEYREEFAQNQLPPHQRRPPPQQPRYNQQPQQPQQARYNHPQPQQRPQYQHPRPQPQQQYPQQYTQQPQQQYPQQQYIQPPQQQYPQVRSQQQPRPQYPQQYPPPQYPTHERPQPQNIPHMKNQQYPPTQGQPRNFMPPNTRGIRQSQYGRGGY